jgi:hypothetical protein
MSVPEPEPPTSPTKQMLRSLKNIVCPPPPKYVPVILNEIVIQNDTLREIVIVR